MYLEKGGGDVVYHPLNMTRVTETWYRQKAAHSGRGCEPGKLCDFYVQVTTHSVEAIMIML